LSTLKIYLINLTSGEKQQLILLKKEKKLRKMDELKLTSFSTPMELNRPVPKVISALQNLNASKNAITKLPLCHQPSYATLYGCVATRVLEKPLLQN